MATAQEMVDSVANLFNRYAQLEMERRIALIETGASTYEEQYRDAHQVATFRNRRAQDPRFTAWVDRRVAVSKVAGKHRAAITEIILESLIRGKPFELDKLQSTGGQNAPKYTDRHIRGLRDDKFSALFAELPPAEDRRKRSIMTVASPFSLPQTPYSTTATDHLLAEMISTDLPVDDLSDHIVARMVDGARLERFDVFRSRLLSKLSKARIDRSGETEVIQILESDQMTQEVLFNHIESILVSEWFRSKNEVERKRIMIPDPPPTLTPGAVRKAIEILDRLSLVSIHRLPLLGYAQRVWFNAGYPDEALAVITVMLEDHGLSESDRRNLEENKASHFFHMEKWSQAYEQYAQLALAYGAAGDQYNELIMTKNLAESLYWLGNTKEALRLLDEVATKSHELSESRRRFGLLLNVACAKARLGLTREAILAIDQAGEAAIEIEDVLRTGQMMQFIHALPERERIPPRLWNQAARRHFDPPASMPGAMGPAYLDAIWQRYGPQFSTDSEQDHKVEPSGRGGGDNMARKTGGGVKNGPSTTGGKSGKGRGNAPSKK